MVGRKFFQYRFILFWLLSDFLFLLLFFIYFYYIIFYYYFIIFYYFLLFFSHISYYPDKQFEYMNCISPGGDSDKLDTVRATIQLRPKFSNYLTGLYSELR